MRQNGRIVSVAVIIAVGVNSDGRREVLGMDIRPSEAETFWTAFLRKLARRGLRGVKLVISDAHEGIKAAVSKVLNTAWQRCRVGSLKKWFTDPLNAATGPFMPSHQPGTPREADCEASREVKHKRSATRAAASRLRLMAAAVR
ncbi:transposase-like protein [Bradyrhizobium japonicum]